jgi:PAS domain-containing protein
MILRILTGLLAPGTRDTDVLGLRAPLARAARDIAGLESLILGARPADAEESGSAQDDDRVEAGFITVWRDAESMVRATGVEEQDRFLDARLRLPLELERADHYEIIGRTFAALPLDGLAYVRVVRVLSRPNEESHLMDTLRQQQPRLVRLGLVASHIGRRVVGTDVEAVSVGIWPDRAATLAASSGRPNEPLYAKELQPWADRLHVDTYDGIEITPRLPLASGPPIFIFDDDLRIVDLTTSAAATLGWASEDLVGASIRDLSTTEPDAIESSMADLHASGSHEGEASWLVPDAGRVFIRVVSRRDVPVAGRHAALVRRVSEPAPTLADLDAAILEAFPSLASFVAEDA